MKKVVLILIVLSGLMAACTPSDSNGGKMWRTVEPRLTGDVAWKPCRTLPRKRGQIVGNVQCGEAPPEPVEKADCDEVIAEHGDARRQLAQAPQCLDQAIDHLTRFARTSPEALNDLSAAYFVRARRDDDPSDFLHALNAATQAVAARPQSATARFNLALIQEALGFHTDAVASWDAFLEVDGNSDWATEGRLRRDKLKTLATPPAERWERAKKRLNAALDAGDQTAVRRVIEEWPGAALEYFNNGLAVKKRPLMAGTLSSVLKGDREPLDRAQHGVEAAGVRLRGVAKRASDTAALSGDYATALALLDEIAPEVRRRGYRYLYAYIKSLRGYVLVQQGQYVQGLAEYGAAHDIYKESRDRENLCAVLTRTQGVYTLAGVLKRGWQDGFLAAHYLPWVRDFQQRNAHYSERLQSLNAFFYPHLALHHQTAVVEELERLVRVSSAEEVAYLLMNLSIALRGRAELEIELGRLQDAQRDIEQAELIAQNQHDKRVRTGLTTRLSSARGELHLRADARRAVDAFTQSLAHADAELPSHRVAMYERRARAHLALNDTRAAILDLERSIQELRREQQKILQHRDRNEAPEFWGPYFSRFRDTYDLLIRQKIETERPTQPEQAFYHNERARAAEPLNLIEQRDLLPPDLRRRIQSNRIHLAYITSTLPEHTYLVQYAVMEDRTYTWILSRDFAVVTRQEATKADVERWTTALQDAVADQNDDRFREGLAAPFAALFDYPLQYIRKRSTARVPRIVVVPDGPMHGLPIAALRDTKRNRYFIEDAIIEIAGSTALYLVSLERDRALPHTERPSIALFGNPAISKQLANAYGLGPLPESEAEVRAIAEDYQNGTEPLTGAAATARAFVALAPKSDTVHVAAHAVVNTQVPYRSFIAFAEDGSDPGDFDALELLRQTKLDRTRLVCLSTCSSAGGAPVGLEGVAPLVRPFIGAGVPAVVGSLWQVNDATTKHLLVSFHRRYRAGNDAAAAMRLAQIEMLEASDAARRAARAWGSFQVIGHASSPSGPRALTKQEKKPP